VAQAEVVADVGFAEVLEGVRRVGAEAGRRADELDRLGVMPDDLYDELAATGCFRAIVPRANGGLEFSLHRKPTIDCRSAAHFPADRLVQRKYQARRSPERPNR
jgi:alkylation response protein AidB-like acyl-CoA dehydrogenase